MPRPGSKSVASRARGRVFKLVSAALGVLLAALVGEIALRVSRAMFRASVDRRNALTRCDRTSAHRELVYEGVPDVCENNDRGFRDVAHPTSVAAGTLRIAVVGDSVAMAQGVPVEAGMARVLERELASRRQRPVDVVAMGHSGYDTAQEIYVLEHTDFASKPRLVVLVYVLNDPDDALHGTSAGELPTYYDRPPSYLASWFAGWLYEMNEKRRAASCGPAWVDMIHCAHADVVEENFRMLGAIARSSHVPILVAIHPFLTAPLDGPAYPYSAVHAELAAVARRHGLATVDLRAAYAGHEADDLLQEIDDPLHPNELGHRLVGAYLAEVIAARSDLE